MPTTSWRPIVLLQVSNFSSGLGNAIVMIAIPWLVLEKTGSPAAAGLVAALSSIPGLLMAPFAGWLIDRLGRRPVSIGADVLSAISVAGIPIAAMTDVLSYPVIVALAVLGATFDPAGYTARRALLPDAAQASHFDVDRLNGIHTGVFATGWTVGPVVAAALIAGVGSANAFWVPCGMFLIAAACVLAMRVADAGQARRAEREAAGEQLSGIAGATRGFVLLWRDPVLRTITFAVLVLGAIYLPTEAVLLPTHFQGLDEPASLGIVITALAGGSAIGAFAYGPLTKRMTRATLIRVALIGVTVGMVPMALLPPVWVMATFGFVLGLAWGPMDPLLSTLVQRRVDDDEQGRVYGVMMAAFYAAPPIAMVIVGAATQAFGVPVTYLVIAGVLVLTVAAVLLFPRLRDVDE